MQVKGDVKKKLKAIYDKDPRKPKGQKFNGWANNLLAEIVDHQEKLDRYGAFIQYIGAVDNHISLFDNNVNKSVTVWIEGQKKTLRCEMHEREDCVHVGFCFNERAVYDKLIENGFRPPKKIS